MFWEKEKRLRERELELNLREKYLDGMSALNASESSKRDYEAKEVIAALENSARVRELEKANEISSARYDLLDKSYTRIIETKDAEISALRTQVANLIEKIPVQKEVAFTQSIVK